MLDPYSASTEEHKLWNEKTRQAQERSARLDAEYIREALLNLTGNPLSHRELYFRRITELFDIWCARTLHFVRTHAEADSFSVWLRKYARDFLCVEFESTQKGVLRGHAELVLEVRICHWNLEARKKVNEAEHLAQVPNFLEMGVTGPGHEAAIALAESRLHAALSGGVPDTALDWDGSPVPICFVLAADYTRTVMEAYAEEVLLPLEPDPSPARYGFCSLSDGHTNYLFDEHFSEDVNFVNQDRRKKRISGEFTGGWYNKDNEARRCRRVKFGINVQSYSATSEEDTLVSWMDVRLLRFWQLRTKPFDPKAMRRKRTESTQTRSPRRTAVIAPLLHNRKLSPSGWATRLGIDPSVVLDYLNGKSSPRLANAKLMSQDLGLSDLPE